MGEWSKQTNWGNRHKWLWEGETCWIKKNKIKWNPTPFFLRLSVSDCRLMQVRSARVKRLTQRLTLFILRLDIYHTHLIPSLVADPALCLFAAVLKCWPFTQLWSSAVSAANAICCGFSLTRSFCFFLLPLPLLSWLNAQQLTSLFVLIFSSLSLTPRNPLLCVFVSWPWYILNLFASFLGMGRGKMQWFV